MYFNFGSFSQHLVGGIQCPYSSDTLEIEKQRFSMFVDAVVRAAPEELGHAGIITKCYNPNVAILLRPRSYMVAS